MSHKNSVVIVPHDKDCVSSKWSGITDGFYYGNYNASPNTKLGSHHLWYKIVCNDPKCKGIKAVHSSVLANA